MTHRSQPNVDGSVCPRCGARRTVRASASQLCPACLLDVALGLPDAPDAGELDADESLPYEIVTILAQDAGAVTYLARGFVSRAHLALKIVAVPDAAAVLARLQAWRSRLERVHHPGLARFVDGGRAAAGRVYLATEYVAGSSLDYLLQHRPPADADRAAIARQLAEALDAAHAQGLAHMRLDATRIKVATSGGVRATILGLGMSLILEGTPPEPDRDAAALADVCRVLGVAHP